VEETHEGLRRVGGNKQEQMRSIKKIKEQRKHVLVKIDRGGEEETSVRKLRTKEDPIIKRNRRSINGQVRGPT